MADKIVDIVGGVEGLRELRAELKRADPALAKRLQQVNKELARRIADRAKSRFYRRVAEVDPSFNLGGPSRLRQSGRGSISRTVASIRANAGQTSASVIGGGPKAPGFFGHEFGGGARPGTRQFPVHRGRDGYALYPTVRGEMKTASREWEEIFDELFETREGPL